MYEAKRYMIAQTPSQAYEELIKAKNNALLGGCGWLKMSRKIIGTAIDLSGLGLDTIEEDDDYIRIGCMVKLRQLETNELIKKHFSGILSECVKGIVGVQFRNCATVGASVFSRFGFSDIITALLVLDTQVELQGSGLIPLAEFIEMPRKRDLLLRVIIKKTCCVAAYQSFRNTRTDFPVLAVAAGKSGDSWRISIGARPMVAKLAIQAQQQLGASPTEEDIERACELACAELVYGSNQRASAEYRKMLAGVLVKRAIKEAMERE